MKYAIKKTCSILGVKNFTPKTDCEISELLTDSRNLTNPAETLFFALETKNNDAHKFVSELYASGVRNFVVTKKLPEWEPLRDANFLTVSNSLAALQKLAAFHRKQFDIPVIGITGSNGKTIVKEWLYQLLERDYNIARSPRSYNSQIGVPLSIWQIEEDTSLAIIEAGISQPDEMRRLETIIRPTIGVFTTLGEAHQENFTSLQQKAMEKLGLFVNSDIFIYEEDNRIINQSAELMVLTQKTYSWSKVYNDAPLFIKKIEKENNSTTIHYAFLQLEYRTSIPFTDDASVENAISCLAVMLYLHVDPRIIAERMAKLEPVAMRLDVREGKSDCIIINDSYNSDINSIKIALDFQQQRKSGKELKKTLILSDIPQTGMIPNSLYKKIAELIKEKKIEKLIGIGNDIFENSKAFAVPEARFFLTTDEYLQSDAVKSHRHELILLKGARKYHFEKISEQLEQRIHETVLEVDLDALTHNYNFYKSMLSPDTKLVCMVKANGYGAGALEVAKTLQYHRCDYFAVAVAEEGVLLRGGGIFTPIIVLNPEVNGFEELFSKKLEPEVYNFRILNAFVREADRRGITNYPIHLKIDTGMHRLGFLSEQLPELIKTLKWQKGLKVKSVFSHLSASESWLFDDFTNKQMTRLYEAHAFIGQELGYPIYRHILNSAGIERFENAQWDMVRLGIGLYGVSPGGLKGLKNVCTLKTAILQIKEVPCHETIGYGRKEELRRDARIATIRIGYADGLNRRLGNRSSQVLINGRQAPIVGNVCMDLCMVDVTDIEAKEGDEVIVFGEGISVIDSANKIDTIPYEILTSVSPRVKRVYVKE